METIQEKIHALIDRTSDPVALENIYNYLQQLVSKSRTDILDDLSEAELNRLHESRAQYRRGENVPHEEVLQLLKKWQKK